MTRVSRFLGATCLGVAMTAAFAAVALKEYAPVRKAPASYDESAHAGRIIVKLKDRTTTLAAAKTGVHAGPQAAGALGQRLGLVLADGRTLGPRTQVLTSTTLDSRALAAAVAADADVEWAEVDHRRFVQAAPSDPLYPGGLTTTTPVVGQWYLRAPDAAVKSSINIEPAWAITTGSSNVVIADIDTGITSNPDLQGKVFGASFAGTNSATPYGYDFVGYGNEADGVVTANDGDGADPDPSDPGDWITTAEDAATGGPFSGCGVSNSSWHGTQTAGILGASTNNGTGMASAGYNTMIVPVRALGKCGGFDSDIIAAAEWAGGIAQGSVPVNTHPARVINMSLGASGACTAAYQDALTLLRDNGVIVVAAAGNDEGLAVGAPANCKPALTDADQTPIVIAVTGLRHTGTKVGFADIGPEVTIAAPGGNCVNTDVNLPCLYPILTTTNSGTTVPASATYTTSFGEVSLGTSFSTPLVAGTVALMLSAAPQLTNSQLISLLKGTAAAFPTTSDSANVPVCMAPTGAVQDECICTTTTCGAGMLNAGAAVAAAAGVLTPTATISGGTSVTAGSALSLSGAGSTAANGVTITGYQWQIVNGSNFATLSNATGSAVTLTGVSAGAVTVALTVTDSVGLTGTTTTTVTVDQPSGGSGGGATNPAWLFGLALGGLLLAPRSRRREP